MQLHIAKGLNVYTIASILQLNFKLDKNFVEHIPVENIALSIKSWLEILQVNYS
jgi:hypothetical protein